MELHNLAHVALHQGEVDAAERRFEEWRRLTADSDAPYDRAMAALNEAAVAAAHGERQRARNRLDRAEEILADAGISLDPDDAFEARHLRGIL
jgi:ATP/maltotriose-dependent transcriptional regulator MalT